MHVEIPDCLCTLLSVLGMIKHVYDFIRTLPFIKRSLNVALLEFRISESLQVSRDLEGNLGILSIVVVIVRIVFIRV